MPLIVFAALSTIHAPMQCCATAMGPSLLAFSDPLASHKPPAVAKNGVGSSHRPRQHRCKHSLIGSELGGAIIHRCKFVENSRPTMASKAAAERCQIASRCSFSPSLSLAHTHLPSSPLKCSVRHTVISSRCRQQTADHLLRNSDIRAGRHRGGPVNGLGGPDAVQTVMVGGSVVVAASMAFYYGFKGEPVICEGCNGSGGLKCFACGGSGAMESMPEGQEPLSRSDMIRRSRKQSGGSKVLQPRGPRPGECRVCRGAGLIVCKRCRGSGYQRRM